MLTDAKRKARKSLTCILVRWMRSVQVKTLSKSGKEWVNLAEHTGIYNHWTLSSMHERYVLCISMTACANHPAGVTKCPTVL